MIVLIVTTVIFGLGPGAQNVGIALFGQWWPTVHNTVNDFMKPFGDMFSQLSQTFGQTLFMLTNPMGFAQQITEGTYVENPTGPTGAYGLDIESLEVDSIYIGEPFSVRFELANKGSFDARNVNLEVWSSVENFNYLNDETVQTNIMPLQRSEKSEKVNYIDWYKYRYVISPFLNEPIKKQDIKPIFLLGMIDCEGQTRIKRMLGITTAAGATLREKFISFRTQLQYEYEVHSNLQIEIISQQEWDSRTRSGMLLRGQKLSRISTAPAKLSLGAMDQPIREDLPMFIGFNLSSAEGRYSRVGNATVRLELPLEFKEKNPGMRCTDKKKPYREVPNGEGKWVLEWYLERDEPKHVFCFLAAPEVGDVPSKTFTISASANYIFERWERKDTLINFRDACEESRGEGTEGVGDQTGGTEGGTQPVSSTEPGGRNYCGNERNQGRYCDIGNGGCTNSNQCYPSSGVNSRLYAINPNNLGMQYGLRCKTNVNNGNGACCPGPSDGQCQAAFDAWIKGENAYQALLDAYS